ncbi:phospholipid carrier-dependent glycosyltransferase [Kocuria rhizophila]|uniref:dolichyl-phosphate-mannose--protein mannosyltransferase n=1 Tax=Kocuria rhizophila TaxID=72000 RepID=UPI00190A4A85|nr:phospholipid carrier-dependent glycosyltransferase [Kocuria rhizophila]
MGGRAGPPAAPSGPGPQHGPRPSPPFPPAAPPPPGRPPASPRGLLLPAVTRLPRWWWVPLVLVTVLGGVLRFVGLASPHAVVFDETYYLKDAYSLLLHGTEQQWPSGADEGFVSGAVPDVQDQPSFVVHPPLGKWLIAVGLWLFGPEDPFGWRFSAAVVGTLSIALIWWAGWLLFRSVSLATIAGLLTDLDGLHLVESRLALLDISLMFFLLLAFVLALLDRDDGRRRLAARLGGSPLGPWLGVRWWRIAAGAACGAAAAVKWNALFSIAALGILVVLWDMNARRVAGVRHWFTGAVLKDGPWGFLTVIGTGLVTYVLMWSGWLATSGGYDRTWAELNPGQGPQWLPPALRSLWEYHVAAYSFHTGLDSHHTYMAGPATWPFMLRPTSYYYESPGAGTDGCTVDACSQAILNVGNPAVWWVGILAVLLGVWLWAGRRDWRFGALVGVWAAGYLPWFLYPERTMFFFYALSYFPAVALLIAGAVGVLTGRLAVPRHGATAGTPVAAAHEHRITGVWARRWRAVTVCYLLLVVALAVFFWPVWTAQTIPYEHWRWRMWFRSWI